MSRQSLDSAQNSSANHGQIKSNYLLKGLVLGLAPAGHPCSSRKRMDLPNPHLVSFPSGSLLLNPMQAVDEGCCLLSPGRGTWQEINFLVSY